MKNKPSSKIFNFAKRMCEETPTYQRLHAFKFKDSQNEFSESFGQVKFFTDESLCPQEHITHVHEEDTRIVLLPIAGALSHVNALDKEELVKSEQIKIVDVKKGEPYTFKNPFENEWINYLHIGFDINAFSLQPPSTLQNIEFKKLDEFVSFYRDNEDQSGHIGIYNGRSEGNYTLKNPGSNGAFIYIISGAFEVQGTLLEYRDGLSLWDTKEIEFEALSNNAIILLLEIKLK